MLESRIPYFLAQLAGDLNDFGASDIDEALGYFLDTTSEGLRADNNQVAICIRDTAGAGISPVGWLPVWDMRHGPDNTEYSSVFRSWYSDPSNFSLDATVLALAKTTGAPRSFIRREVVDDDSWRRAPVQELFDDLAIGDRLVTGIPVGSGAELVLTSYRRQGEEAFSVEDRELATHIATVARPFAKRLTFTHGFAGGLTPLTPRERSVLKALLTGSTEKEIAGELGLTVRSLHQYVVTIYHKLGVTSRAQLMAQFLSSNGHRDGR